MRFLNTQKFFRNYYGTSRETIEKVLATGVNVFLDIDWQGAQQIRKKMPDSRSIFILPPSKDGAGIAPPACTRSGQRKRRSLQESVWNRQLQK